MKNFILIVSIVLVSSPVVVTQTSPLANGVIIEQSECWKDPYNTYDDYVVERKARFVKETGEAKAQGFQKDYMTDIAKRLLSKPAFEQRKSFAGFECVRIKYMSDGLKVVGIIWKPTNTAGKKLPLVIYNRGG